MWTETGRKAPGIKAPLKWDYKAQKYVNDALTLTCIPVLMNMPNLQGPRERVKCGLLRLKTILMYNGQRMTEWCSLSGVEQRENRSTAYR
jgi:hypothetical protein